MLTEDQKRRKQKLNKLASAYPYGEMPIDRKSAREFAIKKAKLEKQKTSKTKQIIQDR